MTINSKTTIATAYNEKSAKAHEENLQKPGFCELFANKTLLYKSGELQGVGNTIFDAVKDFQYTQDFKHYLNTEKPKDLSGADFRVEMGDFTKG